MKEIKAIIQPFMLSKVMNALRSMRDLPGVTVSEVKGFGRSRARNAAEKVIEEAVEYAKKVKLEIVVSDDLAEQIAEVIQRNAHTGNPGDGKIFLTSMEDVMKIRTGQRGEEAI